MRLMLHLNNRALGIRRFGINTRRICYSKLGTMIGTEELTAASSYPGNAAICFKAKESGAMTDPAVQAL